MLKGFGTSENRGRRGSVCLRKQLKKQRGISEPSEFSRVMSCVLGLGFRGLGFRV